MCGHMDAASTRPAAGSGRSSASEASAAASGDDDERRDDDGDGTRSSSDELADDTGQIAAGHTTWRKIAKLSEFHPVRAAPTTCWDSLLPRSARCGSSLEVATHDSCTHDENVVMGEVGYGGVGRGVVRGDAWVARGRRAKKLCYVMLRW